MNRFSLFYLFLLALGLSSAKSQADTLSLAAFQAKMAKEVQRLPSKDTVSVDVQVLGKSGSLFSANENKALTPASNTKLFTTLVGLQKLQMNYTFTTNVLVDGTRDGDKVKGDLVLAGNGDPFLVSERLWLLAREVARRGIRQVSGGIKVNNAAFNGDYRGLLDFQNANEPFAAVVSATSFNFNSIEVHIVPENSGKTPFAEIGPLPHAYATLKNSLHFVAGARTEATLRSMKSGDGKETFEVAGNVGRDAHSSTFYASVENPAAYVADVFAAMLREEGVKVDKDFVGVSEQPQQGILLAHLDSLPLMDLTRLFDTYSNNFMAEQLFQAIGAHEFGFPATLEKSQNAVSAELHKTPACASAEVHNGSGLAWETKASAKCFTDFIQNSYGDFSSFIDLAASFPVGGKTGSLKHRFRNADDSFVPERVRAKTGTLWSDHAVTSLVGITKAASGETLVFALVQNDKRNDSSLLANMRDWEESCVELMQQLKL